MYTLLGMPCTCQWKLLPNMISVLNDLCLWPSLLFYNWNINSVILGLSGRSIIYVLKWLNLCWPSVVAGWMETIGYKVMPCLSPSSAQLFNSAEFILSSTSNYFSCQWRDADPSLTLALTQSTDYTSCWFSAISVPPFIATGCVLIGH